MDTWVMHKSGQGEKWKVIAETLINWRVFAKEVGFHDLPKSEFNITDPPEVWEECTRKVIPGDVSKWREIRLMSDKRFAWRGDALVIERRKT